MWEESIYGILLLNGCLDGLTDVGMDGQMNEMMGGWMDGGTNELKDGWIDGRMDGRIFESLYYYFYLFLKIKPPTCYFVI